MAEESVFAEKPEIKIVDDLKFIKHRTIKDLLNEPENQEFKIHVLDFIENIKKRDFLSYQDIKKEIEEIHPHSINLNDYDIDDSNLGMYKKIINDIDAQRSRVAEIMSHAGADFLWIDSMFESLFRIWAGKFSKQSSDKKREGDAESVLSFILIEKIRRKELLDLAKNKFFLLGAKMEAISKKTIITMGLLKNFQGQGEEYETETPYRAVEKLKMKVPITEKPFAQVSLDDECFK